jgi:hypothetical protein
MFDKMTPGKTRMDLAVEAARRDNPEASESKARELAAESLRRQDEERERMGWEDERS